MLSDLRRQATMIEEYNCTSCGRPLLKADSDCPMCKKNPQKYAPVVESSRLLSLPQSIAAPPEKAEVAAHSIFTPISELKFEAPSWERHLPKLLWAFGGLGLVLSMIRLVFFDFFQALALFQSSLLLITAVVVLKRLNRLESAAKTDVSEEPEQLRIKFFENMED